VLVLDTPGTLEAGSVRFQGRNLRVLCGREKKFKISGFYARKLLKTQGAFLQFPIFSHDPRLRGEGYLE